MDLIISSWRMKTEYKSMFNSRRVVLPTGVARLLEPDKKDMPSRVTEGHEPYEYTVTAKAEELRTLLGSIDLTKANLVRLRPKHKAFE